MRMTTGEFELPDTRHNTKEPCVIGAAEVKWVPVVLATAAAVPGPDTDPASIMLRVTIICCVLGGYVRTIVRALNQRKKPPVFDRVMAGFAMWSANAVVGGVGTYAWFHWTGTTWSLGANATVAFVGGLLGMDIAERIIRRFEAMDAKEAERRARAVLGLPHPDSDPPQ